MTLKDTMKILLVTVGVLFFPPTHAQDATPQTDTAADTGDASGSQEVEINEDNYRRFMELRDERLQRNNLPLSAYQIPGGPQKIQDLPETSQKHLRDELREVIMEGAPWQPGDELKEYPYVPSEGAMNNPALQQQETAAWEELVDNYHQREAQIYAAAARTRAARQAGETAEGDSEADKNAATAQGGQGAQNSQAASDRRPEDSSAAGAASASAAPDPDSVSTMGVRQNALQYLQGNGGQVARTEPGEAAGQASAPPTAASGEQQQIAQGQTAQQHTAQGQTAPGQTAPQQTAQGQTAPGQTAPGQTAPQQTAQADDPATPESSDLQVMSQGTLAIKDLANAQGVTAGPDSSAEEGYDDPRRQ